ncbi:MAG: helix-turn-helix domain-containing protein [Thermoguttaceae bacterium]
MERWTAAFRKNDKEFKELFGVKKDVFQQMFDVLTVAREKRRKKGGPRTKLSVGDQLLMTLQYWREYRTMAHIAHDFGIVKSTVSDTITLVENVLIQDERFHLYGKKALHSEKNTGRTFVVDVTESPLERPKKNKRNGTPVKKSDIQ